MSCRSTLSFARAGIFICSGDPEALRYALLIDGVNGRIKYEVTRSTVRHTPPTHILSVKIPLPPLTTQQAIVAADRKLITRFEKKTQAILARIWDEDMEPTHSPEP